MVREAWSIDITMDSSEQERLRAHELLWEYVSRGPEGTVILQRRFNDDEFVVDTGDRMQGMPVVRPFSIGARVLAPARSLGSLLMHDPYWVDYTGDEPDMLARVYDTLDDAPRYADLRKLQRPKR